ncbi:hypothetical protein GCM10020358_49430 [Amorphoplanes nipponensis]|uniref:TrbL/VirB6 plasmid conjugal transfer protein n=1 Tax=Actinoplanes nipponensis TaxID=135950 RepID=A0A919JPK9_9ACTN|nr:hypothetical protein [Actinoplanes nipponensis]GIE53132.1 hypothetical protein Ani05nite_66660 [Actinoplanes nipponensis]
MQTSTTRRTDKLNVRGRRALWPRLAGALVQASILAAVVVASLLAGVARADAAPAPTPSPSSAVVDAACAAKAAGSVAWCMPWAVRVDRPVPGARSHWVTHCSNATSDADKRSCAAASLTLDPTPRDGTASVLMDGPSTGSGAAGLINCSLMPPPGVAVNTQQQAAWNTKRLECTTQVPAWSAQLYDPDPKQPDCPATDVSCKVQRDAQEALSAGISSGIQGLVDVAVQGTVFLLSRLASLVFKVTTISSPDDAFYSTYNSVAGMAVVLIFVFFIVSTIINGLRTTVGPGPVATLGGLVRAVLGITFAGGIAYTIVAAWDQATNAVIEANARTPYDPSWLVSSFSALTAGAGTLFLAFLLSVFATIGLLLLFIVMLFRGLLATGAALFGAMAMTGQVMAETRHWGRRWFWTVNALGSSKFFIAELWIYGSRSAYGSDNVMNALRAVLLIWLMVAAPWILLRLTTMWDGYLSDVNAQGLLAVAGSPLQLGADFAGGARSGAADAADSSSGGSGSPGFGAAGVMDENTAGMPTTPLNTAGDAAGIGDGTGHQAADAAATGGDGGPVGQPAPGAAPEQSGSGTGDSPNAQEADGVQAGARSAQQDMAAGQLTAPGDATGAHGSLPITPGAAQNADPADGAVPPPGAGGAGVVPGSGTTDPASGSSSGSSPSASGEPDDSGSGAGEQPAGQPAGGGAARSGGGEGAASAAADVPIVPL